MRPPPRTCRRLDSGRAGSGAGDRSRRCPSPRRCRSRRPALPRPRLPGPRRRPPVRRPRRSRRPGSGRGGCRRRSGRRGPVAHPDRSRGRPRPAACARPGSGMFFAAFGRKARCGRARPARTATFSKRGSGVEAASQLSTRPASIRQASFCAPAGREGHPDLAAGLAKAAAAVGPAQKEPEKDLALLAPLAELEDRRLGASERRKRLAQGGETSTEDFGFGVGFGFRSSRNGRRGSASPVDRDREGRARRYGHEALPRKRAAPVERRGEQLRRDVARLPARQEPLGEHGRAVRIVLVRRECSVAARRAGHQEQERGREGAESADCGCARAKL